MKKKAAYKRQDITFARLVKYLERGDALRLDLISQLANLKDSKQLNIMIEGAKREGHLGALSLLSAALVVRLLRDIERSQYAP